MLIRDAQQSDGEAIAAIYNHFIAKTTVTFEEDPVSAEDMAARVTETRGQSLPYLVAADAGGQVTGYAYASKWKGRCAYRYSVETTVYLSPDEAGRGLGSQLYTELLARLKTLGFHAAIGGISLPNPASVALHEKFGFEKIGIFTEVGHKFGDWVDVGYWQKTL